MEGLIECPDCEGTKRILIRVWIDDNKTSSTSIECPVCRGTGNVYIYGQLRKRRNVNIRSLVATCVGMLVCIGFGFFLFKSESPISGIVVFLPGIVLVICSIATIFSFIHISDISRRMKMLEMSGLTGEEKRKTSQTITDDGEISLYQLIDGDEQIDSL